MQTLKYCLVRLAHLGSEPWFLPQKLLTTGFEVHAVQYSAFLVLNGLQQAVNIDIVTSHILTLWLARCMGGGTILKASSLVFYCTSCSWKPGWVYILRSSRLHPAAPGILRHAHWSVYSLNTTSLVSCHFPAVSIPLCWEHNVHWSKAAEFFQS